MPPSAGACQMTDAALNPDCGRAADRSSIMTAIGWRRAWAGVTMRPVSGAATRIGVGAGVGVGSILGEGLAGGTLSLGGTLGTDAAGGEAIASWLGAGLPHAPATRPSSTAQTTARTDVRRTDMQGTPRRRQLMRLTPGRIPDGAPEPSKRPITGSTGPSAVSDAGSRSG